MVWITIQLRYMHLKNEKEWSVNVSTDYILFMLGVLDGFFAYECTMLVSIKLPLVLLPASHPQFVWVSNNITCILNAKRVGVVRLPCSGRNFHFKQALADSIWQNYMRKWLAREIGTWSARTSWVRKARWLKENVFEGKNTLAPFDYYINKKKKVYF